MKQLILSFSLQYNEGVKQNVEWPEADPCFSATLSSLAGTEREPLICSSLRDWKEKRFYQNKKQVYLCRMSFITKYVSDPLGSVNFTPSVK